MDEFMQLAFLALAFGDIRITIQHDDIHAPFFVVSTE